MATLIQAERRRHRVVLGVATLAMFLGALAIRSSVVFGLVVLGAVFIPIERVFGRREQRILRDGWRTDVIHFVVNNLLTTVGVIAGVVAFGTALHAAVPQGTRTAIAGQPVGAQFVEALMLGELCGYWAHRATHLVPLLWKFHRVHHTISEMDWLASARLHPIDHAFTRSCVVIPLYALGFSKATFGAFVVFTTFQALFVHANVRITFGPLRWLVATPEFHHWHHANEPAHYNTNFAGEFPWIDGLFGTLHLDGRFPERYGVDDELPRGYLRQLAWPFTAPR
jgi:sterol desaturase/sphingolipid hydroxylase (fatty acid hydroxylase superfamily)